MELNVNTRQKFPSPSLIMSDYLSTLITSSDAPWGLPTCPPENSLTSFSDFKRGQSTAFFQYWLVVFLSLHLILSVALSGCKVGIN